MSMKMLKEDEEPMKKKSPLTIPAASRLRGGDDQNIYYLDDQGREHCLSEMSDLLQELERLCRKRLPGDRIIDLEKPMELVVLSVGQNVVRCRWPDSAETVTVRLSGDFFFNVFPAEIVTFQPRKSWRYARNPYLSGTFMSARLDVDALGLTPLKLSEFGPWDPAEEMLGDDGDVVTDPAELSFVERRIYAAGVRQQYEMEQILPGLDPHDMDSDPIMEAMAVRDAEGTMAAAEKLMDLLRADLRCLDAYAHLGYLWYDNFPEAAQHYYAAGVAIGELSLPDDFRGLLPWAMIDNRPFLRCLHGYGLTLWRLNRLEEAQAVFARLLLLNPMDNQGARFNLADTAEGRSWDESEV